MNTQILSSINFDTLINNNYSPNVEQLTLYENTLNNYSFSSIILILLIIGFIFSLTKSDVKKWISTHLKCLAILIWLCGFFLYVLGFNNEGCYHNFIALVLRSSVSSIEMFVSHSDLIEVSTELKGNGLYMTLFSFVHFCAVAISAIFILRLLGIHTFSWFKIVKWKLTQKKNNYQQLQIFWNINANSIHLAKSILKEKGNLTKIIFINQKVNNKIHFSRFTFSHFFHKKDPMTDIFMNEIEAMRAIVVNTDLTLYEAHIDKENNQSLYNIFEKCRLRTLFYGFVKSSLKKEKIVNFFFLSDDENENINSIITIKKHTATNTFTIHDKNTFSCYCLAQKNHVNVNLTGNEGFLYNVYIIDSSSLSILQLKKNPDFHPVAFVEKKKGCVLSPFTGMVIGFGETGQHALEFLHEYGSFVKSVSKGSDDIDNITPQTKKIYVIDEKLNLLKDDYLFDKPALKKDDSIKWYTNMSTHSESFSEVLHNVINDLNYLIITLNDDNEALAVCMKIYKLAYKYKTSKMKLGIFIRIKDSNKEEIFTYLNNYLSEYSLSKTISLNLFGNNQSIFAFETINNDVVEKRAKKFYYEYLKLSIPQNNEILTIKNQNKEEQEWANRHKEYSSSLDDHNKLRYMEEQDRSNSWHILTKRSLAEIETGNETQVSTELINILSYTEHLRWNALMEQLGFEYGKNKDMRKKHHPCLISCNELIRNNDTKETIKYDILIVKLSLYKLV